MIRICEDAVIVVPAMVNQRRVGGGGGAGGQYSTYADSPGQCDPAALARRGTHTPHVIPTTAVQTILVADRDFVAAWARCA